MRKTTLTLTLVITVCCMTALQAIADSTTYVSSDEIIFPGDRRLRNLTMTPSPGAETTVTPVAADNDSSDNDSTSGHYHVDSFFDVFTTDPPPGAWQKFVVDSFFDISYEIDFGGGSFLPASSSGVAARVETGPRDPGDPVQSFDTEMISMSLSGNVGGQGVDIRESPIRSSTGQTGITTDPGGSFVVDSFFDVFTELSVDGGPWQPGSSARPDGSARLELIPDPVGPPRDIQKDQGLYGNLDQDDTNPPNGGQYMCGPTAAVNSFMYLENMYPGTFAPNSLVPELDRGDLVNNDLDGSGTVDEYDDMIAVAGILAGNMSTIPNGGGGTAGTWDDMFIYGKQLYLESVLPGVTIYGAQMKGIWGGPRIPPRGAVDTPPIAKPPWVQDGLSPTWQFLYDELVACEDVEILIVDDSWGHFLTVTGFVWNDGNNDGVVDPAEGAVIHYIDPVTGLPGVSPIRQNGLGLPLLVNYGGFQNAELIMTVKESAPEPATMSFLALGGLALLRRRRRRA
ncbi:MAG: PEP-CTERM sorting domain-containing protein [Phycisphaerae bacterium]|nr:PEP-CTERM sorting domain-containing protein [Phycisphaerae bacterium]